MSQNELRADGSDGERSAAEQASRAPSAANDQPPHLPFPVVGMGASAGGLAAIIDFIKAMPADGGLAYVVIQHLAPDRDSHIAEILARHTPMPVHQIEDGMAVRINEVYIIRPGNVVTIEHGLLKLGPRLEPPMRDRPVDDFFRSLAEDQRERGVGIIFSGMGSNGSAGAQAIKAVGGFCIAQDPETAEFPSMPQHLIDAGYSDYILPPTGMPEILLAYAKHPYVRGATEEVETLVVKERRHLRDILAILKSRTKHDFNGYKKPTVLRRIQRRMGLSRVTKLEEYAVILRQSPSEVAGLADDLLIHVTGFFRDAEAWKTLRERVVVPLVAAREPETAVRAWVTACSSGEEAYSLAMLLVEESELANKHLDIKVFATDMSERKLQNARQGVYPGGIETEISPERLQRFFQREDAIYRVKHDLRERVVFAPQNILQDPPFSRLDIVTCRNLLIYLEPDVQQRVLSLLHFGLREGGTLFLGTSETVADAGGELFEPLDKKARLFRRIGPTRHGSIDFPVAPLPLHSETRIESRALVKPTLTQLTARALLAHHTPAAITVDRQGRIVYFPGQTELFLTQPRGEATRELMSLAREGIRSAVRAALQQAAADNRSVTITQGWLEIDGLRHHIAVTASPLDQGSASDYFVLSFHDRGEYSQNPDRALPVRDEPASALELRRVREELQNTIEELQASNEELTASHEEVVSVNEELQSTNEELETGREEMQSLNEELATVNAQLQVRVDEHQAVRNDLASLLASTDIAVLFLDTEFRIRRFTPSAQELIDLIKTDIGRPLSNLAHKFDDPDFVAHAESVLATLIPLEREVESDHGRWFLRRILPYRTVDNRIDGIVVTFVDITGRRRAENALRESEARYRELSQSLEQQVQARSVALSVLHDIVRSDNEAQSVAAAIQTTLSRICNYLGAAVGHAWLVVNHGDELTSSRVWYLAAERPPKSESAFDQLRQRIETGRLMVVPEVLSRVVRTGESFWLEDLAAEDSWIGEPFSAYGLQSAVLLPALTDGKVCAVLEVFSDRRLPRDDRFLEIAPSIAVQLGHVFERKRLEREVALVADQEQQRIGQELHDGLNQQIAGIALLAGGLVEKMKLSEPSLLDKAEYLRKAAEEAKVQSRSLSKGLTPVEVAPDGLMNALRDLAQRTQKTYGISTEFLCAEPIPISNSFVATHLYRIACEAVHNAVKHAAAKAIVIELRHSGGEQLIVRDDGAGEFPNSAIQPAGIGIRIMRHRAELIGASFAITQVAAGGCSVTCTLKS